MGPPLRDAPNFAPAAPTPLSVRILPAHLVVFLIGRIATLLPDSPHYGNARLVFPAHFRRSCENGVFLINPISQCSGFVFTEISALVCVDCKSIPLIRGDIWRR